MHRSRHAPPGVLCYVYITIQITGISLALLHQVQPKKANCLKKNKSLTLFCCKLLLALKYCFESTRLKDYVFNMFNVTIVDYRQ